MGNHRDMNEKNIPTLLISVFDKVKLVCSHLDTEGNFQVLDSNRWIYHIGTIRDNSIDHMALIIDAMEPLLVVYVLVKIPKVQALNNKDSLIQAITVTNYGLLPGCFEMDLKTGEIRYRSVLIISNTGITSKDIAQLISDALLKTQTYAPAFQKVVALNMDPFKAIEEVENQE